MHCADVHIDGDPFNIHAAKSHIKAIAYFFECSEYAKRCIRADGCASLREHQLQIKVDSWPCEGIQVQIDVVDVDRKSRSGLLRTRMREVNTICTEVTSISVCMRAEIQSFKV